MPTFHYSDMQLQASCEQKYVAAITLRHSAHIKPRKTIKTENTTHKHIKSCDQDFTR